MKTIGEIAKVGAGQSAPQDTSAFANDGTPFVRAGSLEFLCKGTSFNKLEQINERQAKIHKLKLYPSGTILFAKSGMSAVQNRVFVLPEPAFVVSHLATVEVKNGVDSKFLGYFWQNFKTSNLIQDPAYPSISLEAIKAVEIELPKPDEQKRIAAILDKADRLRRQRRFAQTLSDSFLQSVFIKMFSDPVSNPMSWEAKKIGDEVKSMQYGPRFYNEVYSPTGVRIIRITDLDNLGNLSFENMPTMEVSDSDIKSYSLKQGDLIFARSGATVGKTALIPENAPICIAGAYFITMRFKKTVNPVFARNLFASKPVQAIIEQKSRQSAQQNFSGPGLRDLPLPLPPLPLQEKFAEIVQKFERVRRQQREATRQAEHLFQTLLHRAFRGEL